MPHNKIVKAIKDTPKGVRAVLHKFTRVQRKGRIANVNVQRIENHLARRSAPTSVGVRSTHSGFLSTPKWHSSGRSVRFHRREYVRAMATTDLIQVLPTPSTTFNPMIIPTDATIFPWLSGMAKNWTRYEFKSLRFCFNSIAGTTTAGYVGLAWFPDAEEDISSSTYGQVMQWETSIRENLWRNFSLDVPKRHLSGKRYLPQALPSAGTPDTRFEATGQLKAFVSAGLSSSPGDLMVEYDIELSEPDTALLAASDHGAEDDFVEMYAGPSAALSANLPQFDPYDSQVVGPSLGTEGKVTDQVLAWDAGPTWRRMTSGPAPSATFPSFGYAHKKLAEGITARLPGTSLNGIDVSWVNNVSVPVIGPATGILTGSFRFFNPTSVGRFIELETEVAPTISGGTATTVTKANTGYSNPALLGSASAAMEGILATYTSSLSTSTLTRVDGGIRAFPQTPAGATAVLPAKTTFASPGVISWNSHYEGNLYLAPGDTVNVFLQSAENATPSHPTMPLTGALTTCNDWYDVNAGTGCKPTIYMALRDAGGSFSSLLKFADKLYPGVDFASEFKRPDPPTLRKLIVDNLKFAHVGHRAIPLTLPTKSNSPQGTKENAPCNNDGGVCSPSDHVPGCDHNWISDEESSSITHDIVKVDYSATSNVPYSETLQNAIRFWAANKKSSSSTA